MRLIGAQAIVLAANAIAPDPASHVPHGRHSAGRKALLDSSRGRDAMSEAFDHVERPPRAVSAAHREGSAAWLSQT